MALIKISALVALLRTCVAMGQVDSTSGPATHLMKHALFICADTSYAMTYVLAKEFRGVTFYRDRLYPADFRLAGMAAIGLAGDTTIKPIIFRSNLLPGIDSLRSLFTTSGYGPPETEQVGYTSYSEDMLTEDAFLNFALLSYGLTELDTTIAYYFGQVDWAPKRVGKQYVLCEVVDWRSASPTFKYTLGGLSDNGFEVLERGTLAVTRKDLDQLRRQLLAFSAAGGGSCVSSAQGESDLLVLGKNKVVFSDHCRKPTKGLRKPHAMTGMRWIYGKYSRQARTAKNLSPTSQ